MSSKSISVPFSTALAYFVSLSHFDNAHALTHVPFQEVVAASGSGIWGLWPSTWLWQSFWDTGSHRPGIRCDLNQVFPPLHGPSLCPSSSSRASLFPGDTVVLEMKPVSNISAQVEGRVAGLSL